MAKREIQIRTPTHKNPSGGDDYRQVRTVNAEFRAVESESSDDAREFELSFSSEQSVRRWYGSEVLDHGEGCVDLSRLQSMGTVLFNHHADKVIGRVTKAWIEGGRGKAKILFDDDDAAETIRKKVASGTLKGVSVGYAIDNLEQAAEGKKSKSGRFTGPCYVATRWSPLEISIVSVPADATVGVGRSEEISSTAEKRDVNADWQMQINENVAKALACDFT